jgi:beta-lactamase superfamily II metal-dependent hydrolase
VVLKNSSQSCNPLSYLVDDAKSVSKHSIIEEIWGKKDQYNTQGDRPNHPSRLHPSPKKKKPPTSRQKKNKEEEIWPTTSFNFNALLPKTKASKEQSSYKNHNSTK